ncbi:MAG: SpoIIE family protein phosphatase [Planctomycetota bacterium]|jgi:PAS domain S-box-containing protein
MRSINLGALLMVCFVVAGSLSAIATHEVLAGYERRRVAAQFDEYLTEKSFALAREIDGVVAALRALEALFDASEEVTRKEFSTFVRGALARHPPIQAMEWIPRVPADQRKAHEAAGAAAGLAGYAIMEGLDRSRMVPAAPRGEYFPVFFVEPLAGNEHALGFDLGSDPARRAALDRAMATGQVALMDPVILFQADKSSKSVLALLPVRAGGEAPADVKGIVVAVFRIADVVRQALLDPDRQPIRAQFELTCTDVQGNRQVLHASAGVVQELNAERASAKRIRVGGSEWRLVGCPTEGFLSRRLTFYPVALAGGVFALAGALGAFVAFLATRSRKLALRRQDRTIRAVLGSLVEGVVVADREGKILLANEAAKRALRRDVGAARPGHRSETFGFYLPDMVTPYPERELPLARAIRGETVSDQDVFVRPPGAPEGSWLRVNAAPVTDANGGLLGGVVTFHDVTEPLESEERARRLSSAVEQTADAVFITDRDGEILYVNPAFEATTGFASKKALGKTPRILKSGEYDLDYYRNLWSTILGGEVYRATTVNRRRNGERYHAEQTITPMKDQGGQVTHFVSVSKDMTERLRIQEQEIEMRLAADVQQQLYPDPEVPLVAPGLDIAGAVFSAEATCGDYFDFIRIGEGLVGVAIGDVSGHGLAAAMVMAQTRAYLRAFAQSERNVAEILGKVNNALCRDLRSGFFVTLLLAAIDAAAGRLVYASAGHSPCYILNPLGEVKQVLTGTGLPLGIEAESEYGLSGDIALEPGDLAAFITDGVTESRSPQDEFFGDEGVLAAVKASRHAGARQIVERVHGASCDFGRPQHDDITIVVCKVDALPTT